MNLGMRLLLLAQEHAPEAERRQRKRRASFSLRSTS